jgi:hypothetical protein
LTLASTDRRTVESTVSAVVTGETGIEASIADVGGT